MILESRYVEYSFGKRVVEGVWKRYMLPCPSGCLEIGISREEVDRRIRIWTMVDDCSNFEYRAAGESEVEVWSV